MITIKDYKVYLNNPTLKVGDKVVLTEDASEWSKMWFRQTQSRVNNGEDFLTLAKINTGSVLLNRGYWVKKSDIKRAL